MKKVVGSLLSTNNYLISVSIMDKLATERGTIGLNGWILRGPVSQKASLGNSYGIQASEGHLNQRGQGKSWKYGKRRSPGKCTRGAEDRGSGIEEQQKVCKDESEREFRGESGIVIEAWVSKSNTVEGREGLS